MSLEVDGFWKAGFWSTTFWAEGFWREGAAPVVVTEVPGGSSRRDKRKKKGPRPRYYWEDAPVPQPAMEVVEATVAEPEPMPIAAESVVDDKAERSKRAKRRLLIAAMASRMLH